MSTPVRWIGWTYAGLAPVFAFVFAGIDAGTITTLGTAATIIVVGLIGGVLGRLNAARKERQLGDLDFARGLAGLPPEIVREMFANQRELIAGQARILGRTNDANAKLHSLRSDASARAVQDADHADQLAVANAKLDEANAQLAHLQAQLEEARAAALAATGRAQHQADANRDAIAEIRSGQVPEALP